VDDAADAGFERRPHHGGRAVHIGAVHGGRVAGPQPVIRRDMEERRAAGKRAFERGLVLERARALVHLEPGEIAGVAPDQHAHLMAFGQEPAHDRGADEARAPRDERNLARTAFRRAGKLRCRRFHA
jgi:hypothetical protein